jgi:hypothetical protein
MRRRGRRIIKMASGQRGRTCYEYFGYPLHGVGAHKLGQINCVGSGTIQALRGMRAGTQIKDDFATMREAEDWIAQCDTWGELQGCDPGAERTGETAAGRGDAGPAPRLTDHGDTHG